MEIAPLFNEIQESSLAVSLLTNRQPFPILGRERATLSKFSQTFLLGIPMGRAMPRFRCAQTPYLSISPGEGCSVPAHLPLHLFLLSDSRNRKETGMTPELRLAGGSFGAVRSAEADKKRFPKTLTMKGGRHQ
jgi:hypothetical protein